jgi:hypothetical protein
MQCCSRPITWTRLGVFSRSTAVAKDVRGSVLIRCTIHVPLALSALLSKTCCVFFLNFVSSIKFKSECSPQDTHLHSAVAETKATRCNEIQNHLSFLDCDAMKMTQWRSGVLTSISMAMLAGNRAKVSRLIPDVFIQFSCACFRSRDLNYRISDGKSMWLGQRYFFQQVS